ncbi:hypothetical protein [Gloeothece verrucosa]|uniref:Uncharacterized protein n=1 Tax=Gloeothece verrucosa (strain PCC 7822) TaxID=497965 RepID=E0UN26_GLOV7|nr:hypothetical protein [Gloeothece verrucosa]ADN18356.1 hypothetical protein Cyan7822_6601 [Gloeothece verrucosa PCC 7822]
MDNLRHIAQGLQAGDQINQAVTGIIVDKSVLMFKNALNTDFNTVLESRLTEAVSNVLTEHAESSQQFAQQFLLQTKTKLAGHLVQSQQSHPIASIPKAIAFDELENFDVSLDAEVARIANEAGTLTIDVNPESLIGF